MTSDAGKMFEAAASSVAEMEPSGIIEPSESLIRDCAARLERAGWLRSVADRDESSRDFDRAAHVVAKSVANPRRGIFVFGQTGCGKTALVDAMASIARRKANRFNLGVPEEVAKLDVKGNRDLTEDAMKHSVILDDMGAETLKNAYGDHIDLAGEFIVRYHLYGERKLFITTNLNRDQFLERYGSRVCSRLNEMVFFLTLRGGDKRKWGAKAPVERRFAAVEGCAVASLPVEGEEPSPPTPPPSTPIAQPSTPNPQHLSLITYHLSPNPQPSTLNPQPSSRALREGGAKWAERHRTGRNARWRKPPR